MAGDGREPESPPTGSGQASFCQSQALLSTYEVRAPSSVAKGAHGAPAGSPVGEVPESADKYAHVFPGTRPAGWPVREGGCGAEGHVEGWAERPGSRRGREGVSRAARAVSLKDRRVVPVIPVAGVHWPRRSQGRGAGDEGGAGVGGPRVLVGSGGLTLSKGKPGEWGAEGPLQLCVGRGSPPRRSSGER